MGKALILVTFKFSEEFCFAFVFEVSLEKTQNGRLEKIAKFI